MKITFEPEDTLSAVKALRAVGITSTNDEMVALLLEEVEKAFQQQFEIELGYISESMG